MLYPGVAAYAGAAVVGAVVYNYAGKGCVGATAGGLTTLGLGELWRWLWSLVSNPAEFVQEAVKQAVKALLEGAAALLDSLGLTGIGGVLRGLAKRFLAFMDSIKGPLTLLIALVTVYYAARLLRII